MKQETSKIKSKTYQFDKGLQGINLPFPVIFVHSTFVFFMFSFARVQLLQMTIKVTIRQYKNDGKKHTF